MTNPNNIADQACDLGSAKYGVQHWWWQRFTAVLLAPLCLWLIFSLAQLSAMEHTDIVQWLHSPIRCALLLILLLSLYFHAALGIQVIIEDYVSQDWKRLILLLLTQFSALFAGLVSVLSVLKIFLW